MATPTRYTPSEERSDERNAVGCAYLELIEVEGRTRRKPCGNTPLKIVRRSTGVCEWYCGEHATRFEEWVVSADVFDL